MIQVLLTLDYELFNGKEGGSIQNCIITPTDELCKVLDKYNFRATFFVDVCFLLKLNDLRLYYSELQKDWDSVTKQLRSLSETGHEIELHIHPNWYRATYTNGKWISNTDDYKLSDIPIETVNLIFTKGVDLLKNIIGRPPIAFRAGGYCIQTFNEFPDIFRNNGIIMDSSVLRKRISKTEKWEWYDYRDIPNEYTYSFSLDVCTALDKGEFIEVSIPTYKVSALHYLYFKLKSRLIDSNKRIPWGDGKTSIGGVMLPFNQRCIQRFKRLFRTRNIAASIDGNSVLFLNYFFKYEIKNAGYFMIMGHPKLLTPHSLSKLDEFLMKNFGKYNNVTINSFSNVNGKD